MKSTNSLTHNKLLQLIHQYRLLIATSIIIGIFLFTRLPFYLHVGILYIFDDAGSYLSVMDKIRTQSIPAFFHRAPLYPLFLAFVRLFSSQIISVAYLQTLLSLLASLFLIYAIYKAYTKYTIPTAIGIALFSSSVIYLHSETAILTENLFINLLFYFVGFLILGFKTNKNVYLGLASITIMLLIYTRPVALFLAPFYVLVLIFLFINKYPTKTKLSFAIPAIVMFLSISLYNFFTNDRFSATGRIAEKNLSFIGTTVTFMETDLSYPDYLNKAIKDALATVPKEAHQRIAKTWKVKDLKRLYLTVSKPIQKKFEKELFNHAKTQSAEGTRIAFTDIKTDVKRVAYDAIKKNPDKYFKFVYTWFVHHFQSFDQKNQALFYPFLQEYKDCFKSRTARYYNDKFNAKGEYYGYKLTKIDGNQANNIINNLDKIGLHKANQNYGELHNTFFKSLVWVWLFFLAFFISLGKLLWSKLKDVDAFLVFTILSMTIACALVICLVHSRTFIRYSYPLSFTYYLAPVFLGILLPSFKTLKNKLTISKKTKKSKKHTSKSQMKPHTSKKKVKRNKKKR